MADFALGLAKTAVEGTLSRVQSAIDEEDKQTKAAQQDLVFITGELQMMQSFLNVASKERVRNEVVRTWVRQLRNLAFDVEDCVEFVIHLDNDSTWNWVWRLVPSCMAPPGTRDLDMAVAELKQLKARVEAVSQRNTRYNLIIDSGSGPILQSPAEQLATTSQSTIDILMKLWEANGRHHDFCNLQKLITKEGNDLQVISLWGSAGSDIEGTQIINKAYCDPKICQIFKSRAWVKLMHPFNPDEFLKNLRTQLQASSRFCQAVVFKGKTSEDEPMKQWTEQRYLVILEGIPSVVEWDIIRMHLPDNNNGSRIIVSTKQIGDAIFFTGGQYRVSVLRKLLGGHYLFAFFKKRSGRRNVMGDLIRLLSYPGVISVWGTGDDKSTLVKELLDLIPNGNEEILNPQEAEGIFCLWADVAHPFSLEDFYLSLLQPFLEDDTESDQDRPDRLIRRFLYQNNIRQCLVVINGLQSTKDWQLIKSGFQEIGVKGYIIIVTNDESVATSCVGDENRVFNVNDVALHPSMQIHDYLDELFWRLRHRQVISVFGASGDTTTILKQVYDGIKHQHVGFNEVEHFKYYVWVDVPDPFNEDEFRLRLSTGLFPDVHEIEELARRLRCTFLNNCIFFINGLQSMEEWELIKPCLCLRSRGRVILIANEESVAKHFVERLEANTTIRPWTKASDYYGCGDNKKASRSIFLPDRTQITLFPRSQEEVSTKIFRNIDRTGVTSVWGIAGVGKSYLVRKKYNYLTSPLSERRFAWVDLPDGPFDLVKFSRLLLLNFNRCDLKAMEAAAIGIMQGQDPIQRCREILRQGQYVVIIDGMRSTYDWDLIETVFVSQSTVEATIVVITTEESIAKHIVKQQADQMINVKCLEDDEAYAIFKKIIDPEELASLNEKVDLAKLVAKCGGLPKVVFAIGKDSGSFLEHMDDDFMLKLETRPQFHTLSGLLSWMHSYFDACSDLVKPYIFYMSVFPASSKIRRGRLFRRWIAEGYSRDSPGCTARENAQKHLSELVKLSIIRQATSKDTCQVNGFFHEYIISRPMGDNLVFALDGCSSLNTQGTGQHLTIMEDWHRDQTVFESIDFARLRSLTIFGEWCSFFISDKMKRLRVLDLEDMIAVTNDDIEQIFVKLLRLKFISLRGCKKISHLPDTLGGLRQLQTLDVRFTAIVMLPSAIIKLQKLQYICAGRDQDWTSASLEDGDGLTSQLPTATSPEIEGRDSSMSAGQPAVKTSPENGISVSPAQAATIPKAKFPPRLPKFPPVTWSLCGSERKKEAQHHSAGVEVPVGIEKLPDLHTVGVVNVNAAGGEAFLKKLKIQKQLFKLRVCGINKKNWRLLCSAISEHGNLKSLSVRFDDDCIDDRFNPPKTLKSLKLYGPIRKLPVTIKALVNLKKLDLEMTIARADDIHLFLKEKLPRQDILNRLCIKVQEDHELDFDSSQFDYFDQDDNDYFHPRVLKMDCSSKITVIFRCSTFVDVKVLFIQCSKGSSFRVSGKYGLSPLEHLKTVWLKGSYSDEQQEHLKELVGRHYCKTAILKLEPL
ncbi:unnamed protein product [Triticum turgidum subsp. durum]|uniref:Disease resistance protein RPM1 n=1 Tax=Triticum turgidum subsp. durum TaxID=4567 RepID=A0A9R0YFI1_TRITD|nr:unnamed protein product [Triticum turgidum subsp. durum]